MTAMVAHEDIQRIADHIAERFRPDRIILFGSQARGDTHEDSDVDLLVILPFEGTANRKSMEILRTIDRTIDRPFALDLVVRGPEDAARRYAEYDPLIRDAFDRGRILYDANASGVDR